MKKKDFFVVIIGLAAALLCLVFQKVPRTSGEAATITVNGEIYCKKSLSENCEIDINGTNIAVIENGGIYMKSADCPDKTCIKSGRIYDSSKSIVCLPNKVIIRVEKPAKIDSVVR